MLTRLISVSTSITASCCTPETNVCHLYLNLKTNNSIRKVSIQKCEIPLPTALATPCPRVSCLSPALNDTLPVGVPREYLT